jgi:hypothetical protein
MSNTENHPLILPYGKTEVIKSVPLILCIGREPNGQESDFDNTVGRYDEKWRQVERTRHKVGVWDTAFWVISQTQDGMTIQKLKRLSEKCQSSILAFTDISRPISAQVRDKAAERRRIPFEWYEEHIRHTLSSELIHRVKLLLIHGVKDVAEFDEPYRYLINQVESSTTPIPHYDLPSFTWRNQRAIEEKLTPDLAQKINEIYSTWKGRVEKT